MVSLYFTNIFGERELLGFYKTYDAACDAAYVFLGRPKAGTFSVLTTERGQFSVTEISREEASVILSRLKFLHQV